MQCKQCGEENERPVYEAIRSPVALRAYEAARPTSTAYSSRWACQRCGRYHFRDGSLYANPFPDGRNSRTGAQDGRQTRPAPTDKDPE